MILQRFRNPNHMQRCIEELMKDVYGAMYQADNKTLTPLEIKEMKQKTNEAEYLSRLHSIYSGIEQRLKNQGLTIKAMPINLIEALNNNFSKVYPVVEAMYHTGEGYLLYKALANARRQEVNEPEMIKRILK